MFWNILYIYVCIYLFVYMCTYMLCIVYYFGKIFEDRFNDDVKVTDFHVLKTKN